MINYKFPVISTVLCDGVNGSYFLFTSTDRHGSDLMAWEHLSLPFTLYHGGGGGSGCGSDGARGLVLSRMR